MAAPLTALAFLLGGTLLVLLLYALRRPLAALARLGVKTALGLGALTLLNTVGGAIGLTLGVNLWNALVLALLGVPGLGLLLMLNWVTALYRNCERTFTSPLAFLSPKAVNRLWGVDCGPAPRPTGTRPGRDVFSPGTCPGEK